LPGGARDDATSTFADIGSGAYFWSSTNVDLADAWYRHISTSSVAVGRTGSGKAAGFSVRCVKD